MFLGENGAAREQNENLICYPGVRPSFDMPNCLSEILTTISLKETCISRSGLLCFGLQTMLKSFNISISCPDAQTAHGKKKISMSSYYESVSSDHAPDDYESVTETSSEPDIPKRVSILKDNSQNLWRTFESAAMVSRYRGGPANHKVVTEKTLKFAVTYTPASFKKICAGCSKNWDGCGDVRFSVATPKGENWKSSTWNDYHLKCTKEFLPNLRFLYKQKNLPIEMVPVDKAKIITMFFDPFNRKEVELPQIEATKPKRLWVTKSISNNGDDENEPFIEKEKKKKEKKEKVEEEEEEEEAEDVGVDDLPLTAISDKAQAESFNKFVENNKGKAKKMSKKRRMMKEVDSEEEIDKDDRPLVALEKGVNRFMTEIGRGWASEKKETKKQLKKPSKKKKFVDPTPAPTPKINQKAFNLALSPRKQLLEDTSKCIVCDTQRNEDDEFCTFCGDVFK